MVKWTFATRFVAWLVIRLCGWCSGVACCIDGSMYSSGQCDETVDYMEFLSVCICFSDMRLMHLLQDPTVGLANGMFLHKNTSSVAMSLL